MTCAGVAAGSVSAALVWIFYLEIGDVRVSRLGQQRSRSPARTAGEKARSLVSRRDCAAAGSPPRWSDQRSEWRSAAPAALPRRRSPGPRSPERVHDVLQIAVGDLPNLAGCGPLRPGGWASARASRGCVGHPDGDPRPADDGFGGGRRQRRVHLLQRTTGGVACSLAPAGGWSRPAGGRQGSAQGRVPGSSASSALPARAVRAALTCGITRCSDEIAIPARAPAPSSRAAPTSSVDASRGPPPAPRLAAARVVAGDGAFRPMPGGCFGVTGIKGVADDRVQQRDRSRQQRSGESRPECRRVR